MRNWINRKSRRIEFGRHANGTRPYHVTFTPRPGISIPWPGGRLRAAPHHGVQVVAWNGYRWYVRRQLLGRSRVIINRNGDTEAPVTR